MSEIQFIGSLVFLFGTIVGSFLNVCIVRLPHEKSIVKPRSHCPECKQMIPWWDNVPLISFVILAGQCRQCKVKISPRYFFVELLTGLIFLFFYRYYGLTPMMGAYLVMVSGFIVATFVDFEHRIIPDEISVGGMCVGLILSLIIPELHIVGSKASGLTLHMQSFGYSLLGVLVGGGSIYAMGILGDLIFRKESMGGGDVKLMAMVGAFLGWQAALLAFFIAPFFGAAYGIVEKIRTNDTAIAYGPFLVLGSLIAMFWGDQIIVMLINGYPYSLNF